MCACVAGSGGRNSVSPEGERGCIGQALTLMWNGVPTFLKVLDLDSSKVWWPTHAEHWADGTQRSLLWEVQGRGVSMREQGRRTCEKHKRTSRCRTPR